MRTFAVIGLLVAAATIAAAVEPKAASNPDADAIKALIATQAERWNAGDLDGFLEGYWKSPRLTFSSGGKTRRGFQETSDRYHTTYATREKMGRLDFSELEVTLLGDSSAFVLGRWKVSRDKEPISGNFTIVLRKIDGQWRIVHDHTSRQAVADEK